jgi:hypothetical protein
MSHKFLSALGFCTLFTLGVHAQDCSWSGLTVNVGSQQTFLSLYHSGPYLYQPIGNNTLEWTIKDFQGNLIFHDSIVGDGNVGFNHSVPITDSMSVHSLLFTPPFYGLVCEIEDTIFWQTTEVIPGTFIYSWAFVGGNWSHASTNVISVEAVGLPSSFRVFPSPAVNDLWIEGGEKPFTVRLINSLGQSVRMAPDVHGIYHMQVVDLPAGMYTVALFREDKEERIRILKQ